MTIRFDRLRSLHAFLNSLPSDQIHLNSVVRNASEVDMKKVKAGESADCGAIACAMGWAGLMPEFRAEGLVWKRKLTQLEVDGQHLTYDEAAVKFFELPSVKCAVSLFGVLSNHEEMANLDSKQAFSIRLNTFFIAHGETL